MLHVEGALESGRMLGGRYRLGERLGQGGWGSVYAATELDAPDHQLTNWTFQVDPAGNVKSVGRTTSSDPHPKFDACMICALRQVTWPVSKAGGSPQVSFTSRTRDNP